MIRGLPLLARLALGLSGLWSSVGEFRKICHPRNVEVYEIREMSFQEHQTCEGLES
jgi:hypothetical protein